MIGMDKKKIILEQIERLLEHHPYNGRDLFHLSFDGLVTLEQASVDGQFAIDLNRI